MHKLLLVILILEVCEKPNVNLYVLQEIYESPEFYFNIV